MARTDEEERGKNLWSRLWRRPDAKWMLGIPIGGFVAFVVGLVVIVGAQATIHATSSNAFCATACHSHEQFIAPEWRESEHYHNRTGVLAGCADCHIPEEYPDKLIVKTRMGITDIYAEFIAHTITTREKYEANRARMAQSVWDRMKANDSKACRTCHSPERFDPEEQSAAAKASHQALSGGQITCIDCHKGVAHLTPGEAQEKYGLPKEEEAQEQTEEQEEAKDQKTGAEQAREAARKAEETAARYRERRQELRRLVEKELVGIGAGGKETGEPAGGEAVAAGEAQAPAEGAAPGGEPPDAEGPGKQAARSAPAQEPAEPPREAAPPEPAGQAAAADPGGETAPETPRGNAELRDLVRRTFVGA